MTNVNYRASCVVHNRPTKPQPRSTCEGELNNDRDPWEGVKVVFSPRQSGRAGRKFDPGLILAIYVANVLVGDSV